MTAEVKQRARFLNAFVLTNILLGTDTHSNKMHFYLHFIRKKR